MIHNHLNESFLYLVLEQNNEMNISQQLTWFNMIPFHSFKKANSMGRLTVRIEWIRLRCLLPFICHRETFRWFIWCAMTKHPLHPPNSEVLSKENLIVALWSGSIKNRLPRMKKKTFFSSCIPSKHQKAIIFTIMRHRIERKKDASQAPRRIKQKERIKSALHRNPIDWIEHLHLNYTERTTRSRIPKKNQQVEYVWKT